MTAIITSRGQWTLDTTTGKDNDTSLSKNVGNIFFKKIVPITYFFNYQHRNAYSPNTVAAAAAATDGWATHHLAVSAVSPDWIDASRAAQHAGLTWPPHSHEPNRYVSPGGSSMKWEVNSGVGMPGNGGYKKSKSKGKVSDAVLYLQVYNQRIMNIFGSKSGH